jgi:hypothetical protein
LSNNISPEEILELINQKNIVACRKGIEYQKSVALSIQSLTENERDWIRENISVKDSINNLSEDELIWLKQISKDKGFEYDSLVNMPPDYIRYKKKKFEIEASKEIVRKKLDYLRTNSKKFTPEELIELRKENIRVTWGVENFAGIYIIHNTIKDSFYVGKAKEIFNRAYNHFVSKPANNKERNKVTVEFNLPEIYEDYRSGEIFKISLISLKDTTFLTLNDLEAYAICAYNASVENGGYNRTHGNVLSKVQFENEEQEQVANLILNKIEGTEIFSSLTNDKKRIKFTKILALELALPSDSKFFLRFPKKIKQFQKVLKAK